MTSHSETQSRRDRARALGLHGLSSRMADFDHEPWVDTLLDMEEAERRRRGLERRLRASRLGKFKPIADFDWQWPKKVDRGQIEDLLERDFVNEAMNVVLLGPNGVGKTLIAKNLADRAIRRGHSVLSTTSSALLTDLGHRDTSRSLEARLRAYTRPHLLLIDELGYLSHSTQQADLLFEVVSRRYEQRSIVLTTNLPFTEWSQLFPNAACVVTLIDRLVHNAEIVQIEGVSYRLKEAKERQATRRKKR